ncbi:MBL fold metallo-hydrolase [Acetivibrio clariflavus]|uniref:Metal-dependent hydrolase, beta-lactamase superfamily I n=1 Tax=Acetivibrio clariflavus (strain DSM 19732 / NBRC 101661 / EBR45) TaxID=720554 RepID=G8LUF1_ACECE|nr:MBL fold metallo-hydrolase [Acetivibrio clariflavus]AEV70599.1 metal-dependent hydrolase, beta-lactamase superfamily I [Acetivibrio clariflavus DSM 19732]
MIKFCSLYSGSSGNSLFISDGRTKMLIDSGISGKRIIEALVAIGENPSELSAILVTHEHSDHIKGVGILSRKFDIPIYANENTWNAMEQAIGPVNIKNKMCFCNCEEFKIGNICIKAFPIPHDAVDPVGFNFFLGSKKITTATDIGHITKELISHLMGSDLLFIESNHDVEMLKVGPYPWPLKKRILGERGHLSNEMAGKVVAHLAKKGTKKFLLGHLSRENNFPELAYRTVCNVLDENDICAGRDVMLSVALRDQVGEVVEV